ncbi:DUF4238 domain-containing protein [Glaciecola sp. 2405UD65-10]|uniref:DUF4238 domain-containing protein n=1 Tax=Glaciecola sp. 2405UD65-10 TaxID=3397244 RepID=UPI003B5A03F9
MNVETKKQHYVPQFLLNNWSCGKKKRLHIFDKKESKSFCSSVRNSAHENNFYNDDILGYGNKTETKLSSLEADVAPIIKKIISAGSLISITQEEHHVLCLFTAVQMLRTNSTREFITDFQEILDNKFGSMGFDIDKDEKNSFKLSDKEIKSSSINILNTLPGDLLELFIDKDLILLKAHSDSSFYISDNPIVKHNNIKIPHRGSLGLSQEGIEVYFPLSPHYCLLFLCEKTSTTIRKKYTNYRAQSVLGTTNPDVDLSNLEFVYESLTNKAVLHTSKENIEFNNSQQVIQSTRFVYSNNADFDLAFDMLKTNPEIATQSKVVDGSTVF